MKKSNLNTQTNHDHSTEQSTEDVQKKLNDGLDQYQEARKKVEKQINRGARITEHKINL